MINKRKDILNVAAYARVSTDKDDQANSLESQKSYFAGYIKNHPGWRLKEIYYDEGISGTQTRKRAGFNRMVNDALNGEIDLIITKEVSRFARNTVDTLSYTRKLKAAGVGVIFTIDNINTNDCDGELRLTIMASIAQEESRKTSERVKWGQRRRMEQGVVFGRDLLGYTVKNGKLEVNEDEAPIVREIFNKFTNEGKGTHVIARELAAEGLRPKRVREWSNTVILRALRNEKYVGDLCQKKTFTPEYLTHAKKYNRGEEEMVYIRDHHEPIIDRELWDRTQEELRSRAPSDEQKLKHSNRYWCSGRLFCAECGNRYVGKIRKYRNGEFSHKEWCCFAAVAHGTRKVNSSGEITGCDNKGINEKAILYCMSYCINLIQQNNHKIKDEVLEEVRKVKTEVAVKSDTPRIQNRIDAIEEKKRKAVDAMLGGIISEAEYKEQKEWYDSELADLKQQLADSESSDEENTDWACSMQKYADALDEIMKYGLDDERIYREVLDHMDIHRDKVIDVWLRNIPFGIRLRIKTSGRMDSYRTEILSTEFISK